MTRFSLVLLSLTVAVLSLTLLASQALAAPAPVDTQVSRVALFKNGLAFVIRHGELPAKAGEVRIGPLPAASHGTLWLSYDPATVLANLSSGEQNVVDMRDAISIPELLRANVGKKVKLILSPTDSLEGVIKAYQRAPKPEPPSPYLDSRMILPPPNAEVVIFQTDAGVIALNPSAVSRIAFLETPNLQIAQEGTLITLDGTLVKPAGNRSLTVSYLTKGLTWAPSYVIDISTPKTGMLTAKAEIINEVEDLKGVAVDLVTGYPFLQYADILSPLSRKENLTAFLNAMSSGASQDRQRREYSAMTQMALYNAPMATAAPSGPMPSYGSAQTGVSAEDLFLYPIEKVVLPKDHTGYYPLFSEKIAYEHVYEWDIPDYVNEDESGYRQQQQEAQTPQVVWHSLRLRNTTKLPWTTAPAETMLNGQILGQAIMPYTAPGGETLVKITQAPSIDADQAELEVNREVNALQRYGWSYDRITVEGKLALHNYKAEAVTVKVTKTVTGEIATTTPTAKVDKLAKGLRAENPRSRLTWEIPLAPGAGVEIVYTYKVLIRR